MVQVTSIGNLTISPSNLNATALNRNMILSLGSQTTPNEDDAFTIESTRPTAVKYTFSLQPQPSFDGNPTDVTYTIQKNTGTTKTLTADNTSIEFVATTSDTLYISVQLDSTDTSTTNLDTTLVIDGQTDS